MSKAADEALLLDVTVVQPHGRSPIYGVDPRTGALRWEGVRAAPASVCHLAAVPGTGHDGRDDLAVLLVTALPVQSGCVVEARLLGGLTGRDGLQAAVAVPVPDDAQHTLDGVPGLDAGLRTALLDALYELRPGATPVRWIDATETAALVRERRREAAAAQAREPRRASGAAWLATAPPRLLAPSPGGPHTWAEHLLPRLPLRFQKYVAGLLLDDERILFFLERPAFRIERSGPLGRLRCPQVQEGLLVVTDRSLLVLEDALPPGMTMVHWGYLVQAVAVERIVDARVDHGPAVALAVTTMAPGSAAVLSWPFPAAAAPDLASAAALLRRFAPSAGTLALRRLYQEPERRGTAAELASVEGVTAGSLAALEREQRAALPDASSDTIAAAGRTGAVGVDAAGVWWQMPDATGRAAVRDLAWLEMKLALTGCHLRLIPAGARRPPRIPFDYPAFPEFLAVFTRLRHRMGRP